MKPLIRAQIWKKSSCSFVVFLKYCIFISLFYMQKYVYRWKNSWYHLSLWWWCQFNRRRTKFLQVISFHDKNERSIHRFWDQHRKRQLLFYNHDFPSTRYIRISLQTALYRPATGISVPDKPLPNCNKEYLRWIKTT